MADGVANTGEYDWTVPGVSTTEARAAVVLGSGGSEVAGISGKFSIQSPVGVGDEAPVAFALRGTFPNPTTDALHVGFSLADSRHATLSLYDVTGRRVASREVGVLGAGRHTVTLAERLPAGLYVVRLSQGGRSLTTRAAVVR